MRRIADYELADELGRGNHGRFYKAVPPPRLGVDAEWVALKLLDQHADGDGFRRFANELQILAAVRSPHLAGILDAGQQAGILFYAMPYYERGSLATTSVDRSEAMASLAAAARGAHALHDVGVAHRDIKPNNILLDGSNGAVLADLGLAQVLNPGQTVTGHGPIGSIEFMAPSVILGEPASRQSDVWSLGATLHRVVTGESIRGDIPTDDVVAALRHVLETQPVVSENLDGALAEVVWRCVDPAGEAPFPTAEEFAVALEAAT